MKLNSKKDVNNFLKIISFYRKGQKNFLTWSTLSTVVRWTLDILLMLNFLEFQRADTNPEKWLVCFSLVHMFNGISTFHGLSNAETWFISKDWSFLFIYDSRRGGLVYLFNGISISHGCLNAKIWFIVNVRLLS